MSKLRRLWNGMRWGSSRGPSVFINWDARTVTCARMSWRDARRILHWLALGDLENQQVKEYTFKKER